MPLDGDISIDDLMAAHRREMLPPDVEHAIDSIFEDDLVDAGSYVALRLFAPREPVAEIIDREPVDQLPSTAYMVRATYAEPLLELADLTIAELPEPIRNGIARHSLAWLDHRINTLAEFMACWAFEDAFIGGCMDNFHPIPKISRNGMPWRRTMRRLHSPSYIRRRIKAHHEPVDTRLVADRVLGRVERASALPVIFEAVAAQLNAQREEARAAEIRRWQGAYSAERVAAMLLPLEAHRIMKKQRRRRRAVVKRSLALAQAVLPDEQIRAFVRGERVTLKGQTLDLVAVLSGGVAQCGHGVVSVSAVSTDGKPLASLCTYIPETPALDQLVALALAMQAGEEGEIIAKSNITTTFPAGPEHPLIHGRIAQSVADLIARASADTGQSHEEVIVDVRRRLRQRPWSQDETRRKAENYWMDTTLLWKEYTAVVACGRRVRMLERLQ